MAPHSFWIIVDGETPTSFRSREREDLVPTLTQLKRTQPQVALMWFERGRLWPSPTEAREALITRRQSPPPGRGRQWRPGGDHVDPRAKYAKSRDEKRARFKARATRDRQDEQREPPSDEPPGPPTTPPRPARPPYARDRSGPPRPFRPQGPGGGDRPAYRGKPRPPFNRDRPAGDRPREERPRKPHDSGPRAAAPAGDRKIGDRPWRPRKPWAPKGPWRPKKPRGPKS